MIHWPTIETVLLDMDGTLLDLHFDNYFWRKHLPEHYANLNAMAIEEATAKLETLFAQTQGTLNWYCLDYWTKILQVNIVTLKHEITHKIALRPHVVEFLTWLRNNNKTVVMVTNAHRDSLNIKMDITNLDRYFDAIISSHDYRAAKENQSFWQQLHRAQNFDKTTTLLIDDSAAVLNSARTFGIKHLLGVHQPDSQQAGKPLPDFDCVQCYQELMRV